MGYALSSFVMIFVLFYGVRLELDSCSLKAI